MKKLTPKQIELLPTIRAEYAKKRDAKSKTLVQIIDDYTSNRATKNDEKIIKTAVMLYQANQKKERIEKEKRSAEYEKNVAEKKALAREKIILGAIEQWTAKHNNMTPYLPLLMAWRLEFLSPRDVDFIASRFVMEHGYTADGNAYWHVSRDDEWYAIYEYILTIEYKNSRGVIHKIPRDASKILTPPAPPPPPAQPVVTEPNRINSIQSQNQQPAQTTSSEFDDFDWAGRDYFDTVTPQKPRPVRDVFNFDFVDE